MRRIFIIILLLNSFFFISGCEKSEEPAEPETALEIKQRLLKGIWHNYHTRQGITDTNGRVTVTDIKEDRTFRFDGSIIYIESVNIEFPYTLKEENGKFILYGIGSQFEIRELTADKLVWMHTEMVAGVGKVVYFQDFKKK